MRSASVNGRLRFASANRDVPLGRLYGWLRQRHQVIVHGTDAAQRFGTDRETCEAVLGALVNSGVLARTDDGGYVRFFPRLSRAA